MDEASRIGFASAYTAAFVVAMLGNTFVIHTARMRLRNKSSFNILIINMAVCDILYALSVVPWSTKSLLASRLWSIGNTSLFFCKFFPFAMYVAITASVFSLTLMAFDRYFAIVPKTKKPMTRKGVLIAVFIVWATAIAIGAPQLYAMRIVPFIRKGKSILYCIPVWSQDPVVAKTIMDVEFNILFVLNFALPVIVMTVLYSKIIRFLWLRKLPGARSLRNERTICRQKRKVVLMLFTMVLVFIAGWLSLYVVHFLKAYNHKKYKLLPIQLVWLVYYFAHANCAINPCLYPIFHKEYRDELYRILWKRFSCCRCLQSAVRSVYRRVTLCRRRSYSPRSLSDHRNTFEGTRNRAFSVWDSVTAISIMTSSLEHERNAEQNMRRINFDN